ncbi:MAG: FecR domain-containing protein [Bacteroidota bacterium]
MDIYERLVENPLFFKWIYHPGPEIDSWWKTYLELNPTEADQILLFKQRFKALGYSVEKLSDPEKKVLARKIVSGLESIDAKRDRHQFMIGLAKYAAIALLFFSIGSVLVYLKMDKQTRKWVIAESSIPTQLQGPVLILPEGSSIPLKKTESSLDYSKPDRILLNNESVIKQSKESEKIANNQLIIPFGNRSKVTLSDNTIVWLNAGSRLIYPSRFTGERREVLLFGEAYFEVAKNAEMPFVVKTTSIEVKVLGTEFNVSAYPDDNVVQTVLKNGSVSIRRNHGNIFEKELVLTPNQMALFDKTTQDSKIYTVDANDYTIWTKGLLSFDDLEMCRVLKSLERYYNIQIRYADPMVGSQRISGKLDLNKSLNEVFEYMSKVSSTKFKKLDDRNYQIK